MTSTRDRVLVVSAHRRDVGGAQLREVVPLMGWRETRVYYLPSACRVAASAPESLLTGKSASRFRLEVGRAGRSAVFAFHQPESATSLVAKTPPSRPHNS